VVTGAQVYRDDNYEYRGKIVGRAQRIFEAIGLRFRAEVEEPGLHPGIRIDAQRAVVLLPGPVSTEPDDDGWAGENTFPDRL
jgi:hypothetical protein